ncbi:bifunctional diguanylate cyclase/phosphodiesterase [Velocimicrobium porci]|uniref:Bifunctional diguanylate cyclase/phosphodiesterase n=1 Tax=Velocimicrobium porci TaxID=2606634 RepID=A0A6L5Y062_9FIRM|nr:bifunctional diguanylate cyclase/phosphodiesterase [Velocimicrobium porci]MSS64445.1 bifunctional diguanylate cyclase/phosphodiesterase [Velocimicrobium porci]
MEETNRWCFFEYDIERDIIIFSENEFLGGLSGLVITDCKERLAEQIGMDKREFHKLYRFLRSQQEIYEFSLKEKETWYRAKASVVGERQGDYKKIGCITNITKEKEEKEILRKKEKLDTLTGFYNSRNAWRKINHYLEHEGKEKQHVMFLIDIDKMKKINEELGYLFGDTILVNIAESIRKIMQPGDIAGRVGGDDFVLLLTNVDKKEAEFRIEKLKDSLRQIYTGEKIEYAISCSIGGAIYPEHGENYKELFHCADIALFCAKKKGIDLLEWYQNSLRDQLPDKHRKSYNFFSTKVDTDRERYVASQEITNFAFDIMSTTKDVYSAIHLLLEKIGKEYGAQCVGIYEKSRGETSLKLTYAWKEKKEYEQDIACKIPYKDLDEISLCYDENGIYIATDVTKIENGLRVFVTSDKITSMLQCAFLEEGEFRGCVSLVYFNEKHTWNCDEKDSFIKVTKIIAFYLLKLRVSERIQERLEHMKNYDPLTGISTLYKFKKDAKRLLHYNQKKYALIYADITNFKYVNDTYGYRIGDRILYDLALMANRELTPESLLARVSADNFVCLVPFNDERKLTDRVKEFSHRFSQMQKKKNIIFNLVLISGICVLETGYEDISTAIDNANIARKYIKESSNTACQFYNESMTQKIRKEVEITNCMEEALQNGEFVVYLQPKIGLKNDSLAGAEALIRWKRGEDKLIPPNEFIPLFEKNGFILQLDFYVYEEICKKLRFWIDHGIEVVPISVNVSRVHLNDEAFVEKLLNLVNKYHISPGLIELELTESIFLDNTEVALSIMSDLKGHGFSVSIDDFGAGYSSLNLLKDMSSDVIKLDKEFFSHGEMQKEEQIIVSNIIHMAKQLNMKVLSEGIETKMQCEFLKKISCDMVQGYFYAKPMPIPEFEKCLMLSQ